MNPATQTNAQSSEKAILIVVSLVQFMVPFLLSSLMVALPPIGRDLHASAVQLSLIQSAIVLGIVVFLMPVGRFADIHGRKRIFIIGISILSLATLILTMVQSIEIFILVRFIQGVGVSMIFSTSFAILTAVVPAERLGRAMGIAVASVYAGMACGPSISGFIIDYANWRWVFGVGFIFQILALLLTLTKFKGEWTSARGESFDWVATLIYIASMFLLVYGATQLVRADYAKWFALVGLMGMMLFLVRQWRSPYPILDVHLLVDNLAFTFSNMATFINYAATFSFLFFFGLYLQYVIGLTPKFAGLLLIIQPLVQTVLAPIAGRLADTYPPSYIATVGMGFCTIALFLAGNIDPTTPIVLIITVSALLGVSMGLFSTPNMTAIMSCVTPRHYGTASSFSATMRTIGMLASATIIAITFSFYMGSKPVSSETIDGFMKSMRFCLHLFSAMSLMGTFFSMIKGRLAASMSRPHATNSNAEAK
jgi:MFS family permease